MEDTHAKNQQDPSTIAMNWLKAKMKERFERDFNLDHEVIITFDDSFKVSLTPETSKLSQQESLGLSFFVNHINSDHPDTELLISEINGIK